MIIIIKLNGRDFHWEDGLTIAGIIEKKNFTFPKIIVKLNGQHIEKEEYEISLVKDGDNVQIIHLLAGG